VISAAAARARGSKWAASYAVIQGTRINTKLFQWLLVMYLQLWSTKEEKLYHRRLAYLKLYYD